MTKHTTTVSVTQCCGIWRWARRTGHVTRTGRERFLSEANAVAAAFSIARCHNAALDVTPRQWSMLLCWLSEGQEAFRQGYRLDTLRNVAQREGWWMEAQAEAIRQESDAQPWLDSAPMALTLEDALLLQLTRTGQQIDANWQILGAR